MLFFDMILQKQNPPDGGPPKERLFSESSKIKYIFLSFFFTIGRINLSPSVGKKKTNALKPIYTQGAAGSHLCLGLDCGVNQLTFDECFVFAFHVILYIIHTTINIFFQWLQI